MFLSFIVLIAGIYSVESVEAAETYKIWVLAYNVNPNAGFVSACVFGPSIDTPNCAYFDLSKIFTEKGGKKDFIVGFVPIVSNVLPPTDTQVCLEAQLLNGTNASPGNWFQCKSVIKDNGGFYIGKIDFTGLDHTKLSPYHPTNSTSSDNNLELTVAKDSGQPLKCENDCVVSITAPALQSERLLSIEPQTKIESEILNGFLGAQNHDN